MVLGECLVGRAGRIFPFDKYVTEAGPAISERASLLETATFSKYGTFTM